MNQTMALPTDTKWCQWIRQTKSSEHTNDLSLEDTYLAAKSIWTEKTLSLDTLVALLLNIHALFEAHGYFCQLQQHQSTEKAVYESFESLSFKRVSSLSTNARAGKMAASEIA